MTLDYNFKYKLIKNFLNKEEIKLLTDYCRIKQRLNFDSFDFNRMIIWPSTFLYPHTVKPVTKGTRYSVVAWAL